MSEKEAIKILKEMQEEKFTAQLLKSISIIMPSDNINVLTRIESNAIDTILHLLEQKDNKIKELEADLYSANCTINEYIEERNKLKDKMIGDRMEQFDDYVIYLIESYLEIMGE